MPRAVAKTLRPAQIVFFLIGSLPQEKPLLRRSGKISVDNAVGRRASGCLGTDTAGLSPADFGISRNSRASTVQLPLASWWQLALNWVQIVRKATPALPFLFNKFVYLFSRYRWMREYYRQHHLDVVLPGCRLRDASGRTVGYLEDARLKEGRLHLRGWTLAQGISFRLGQSHVLRTPQEERDDVAQAFGCHRHVGFQASLPFDDGPLLLDLDLDGQTVPILHDLNATRAMRRADWRLDLALGRDILPLLPKILRGILRNDPDLPR